MEEGEKNFPLSLANLAVRGRKKSFPFPNKTTRKMPTADKKTWSYVKSMSGKLLI